MERFIKALEEQDFFKALQLLLEDLQAEGVIDGAILFLGENLAARIITDKERISGTHLGEIYGVARSFIQKAIQEKKELFEDNLLFRRGSDSSLLYEVASLYVCPIFSEHQLAAVFYVDRLKNKQKFSPSERLWMKFLGNVCQHYVQFLRTEVALQELQREIWVGSSSTSELLRQQMRRLALLSPVLILGETGVGKSLAAEILHKLSGRKGEFVVVSSPSLPESLFEAELFGCKKSAYTGAEERIGLVGEAHQGTLFFDEISEIDLSLQAKLLRFIDTGYYRRLGEEKERKADIKIICASNKNLEEEVKAHRFRQDLYFRISTYPLKIPPLRERKEDIEELTKTNLKKFGFSITRRALEKLKQYNFPGNVRELQNILHRAIQRASETGVIDETILADELQEKSQPTSEKIGELLKKMTEDKISFWEAVKKPFLAKDLNRQEVREIIRRGLGETPSGRYKELCRLFNLGESEYHNFMAFLHKHKLIDRDPLKN